MAQTKVVLTEDIYKLGTVGDLVIVKAGYARNFLIPKGHALRATKANLEYFEAKKADLEEIARQNKAKAVAVAHKIDGKVYTYIAAASERGMLYGAVTPTVVAQLLAENDIVINKNTIQITKPIKILDIHEIRIALHNEVSATISLNVARNAQEAQSNLKTGKDKDNQKDDLDSLNIPEVNDVVEETAEEDDL
ncbi:MAG: large subunit ribosomal protein L9 [Alphaproteobacteria bacterium]|jgi:large subunit ribosomal protein L9